MKIDVRVDNKTEDALREIAKLKNCSIDMAAQLVLERYARRTQGQIERVSAKANGL
jgi:hypothetical protein